MSEKLGKKYKGDNFPQIATEETVQQDAEIQAEYAEEGAEPLDVYLAKKQITNPSKRAAMFRFTRVRAATPAKWDEIFKKF